MSFHVNFGEGMRADDAWAPSTNSQRHRLEMRHFHEDGLHLGFEIKSLPKAGLPSPIRPTRPQ